MVLLPQRAFRNILSFCDNRLEKRQKLNYQLVIKQINRIIHTHPFSREIRYNPNFLFSDYNDNWYRWLLLRIRNNSYIYWYENSDLKFHYLENTKISREYSQLHHLQ